MYTPISDLIAEKGTTELAHQYSIHTAEIDDIITHNIDKVLVGKVISCEKHPESKKLSIVRVDLGSHGDETILTGAENILNAKYVAVAVVGAVLGGDFEIGERKMAGMISRGMICSDDELGLASERAEGIMILEEMWDEDTLENMLGRSFFELELSFPGIQGEKWSYKIADTTFEIDNKFITNRPDLFSVVGNAREWGAVFDKDFTTPLPKEDDIVWLSESKTTTEISSDACLAYSLLEVGNLDTKASPFGIKIMMEKAGLSPKFDLVDITNLILTEYGQPMHVFDADKIAGKISVRMARAGEKILALNNTEYTLTEKDFVIADGNGPVAIAGVIGGMHSAVSETTTRVFFESATFDATSVRLTAQRHGIRTDASTRYEKSLDPTLAGKAFTRVMEYLEFLGKDAKILSQSGYLTEHYNKNTEIAVPYALIKQKAGIDIPFENIEKILTKLGFEIIDAKAEIAHMENLVDFAKYTFGIDDDITPKALIVGVPSWRATKDVTIAEDIAEEILRVYGYENIPSMPFSGESSIVEKNAEKSLRNTILEYFSSNNWNEIYNYSFTNTELQEKILQTNHENLIAIQNAYTEDYTHMRTSLAPRIFMSIATNLRHDEKLKFFEIGKVYAKNIENGVRISELLATQNSRPFPERIMIAGATTSESMSELRETLDSFFLKLFGKNPLVSQITENTRFFHPGATGQYSINGKVVATFGRIHPEVVENFEIPASTLYFEMDFDTIFAVMQAEDHIFSPLSAYQSTQWNFNFVLPKKTETSEVAKLIEETHPWISRTVVDSVYEDAEKVGIDKKSVNFSCTIQSMDGTISDEEAKTLHESVIAKLEKMGYKLRGF